MGERAVRVDSVVAGVRGVWIVAGASAWLYLIDRTGAWLLDGNLFTGGAVAEGLVFAAHASVCLAVGLVGGLVALGARVGRPRASPAALAALACAALGAGAFAWLGVALAHGDWIARQAFAPLLGWGAGAIGALLGAAYGRCVLGARSARAWALAWAVASGAASVADAVALPGLYPDAHLALYVTAAVCALTAIHIALGAWRPGAALRRTAPIVVVALLAGAAAWRFVPGSVRGDALSASAMTSNLVTRILPPPRGAWLRQELRRRAPSRPRSARGDFFTARPDTNVLLVIVDTLRGDALPPARDGDEAFVRAGDTPFLDAWLQGSYRFTRSYAQATRTRYSMPPLFHSADPFEDTDRAGLPLATQLARLGRTPVAVVPQYFLMPVELSSRKLLDGFERVAFYEKDRQNEMAGELRAMLQGVRDRPFFAWVHFYNMHQPYYANRPTTKSDGSLAERYRLALRWLDGQLRGLVELLRELHLSERTVVVFAADHGESIGDPRHTGHGGTVFDREARVPLAITVPGKPGGLIDATVGNIDIVPTIFDLLGAAPLPEHRGRSLVPLMRDPHQRWEDAYYVRSGSGTLHAVVQGGHKLVFSERTGTFSRYDLARDPQEKRSRFRETTERDRRLVGLMLRKNPALARAELKEEQTTALLASRLDGTSGDGLDAEFEFLARTAGLTSAPSVQAAAERLFRRATSFDAKLAIAEQLRASDAARWDRMLDETLRGIGDEAVLERAVDTLARRGHGPLAVRWMQGRIRGLAHMEPTRWDPWLRLVLPWPKRSGREWAASFAVPLRAAGTRDVPPLVLALLLENVATVERAGRAGAALAESVRGYVAHADPAVSASACRALGRVGSRVDVALLRQRAAESRVDVRVRQALMHALAKLEGQDAVDVLLALAEDPLLTVDAVQLLGTLKSSAGLPFLRGVARRHYNAYTRGEARKAIAKIARP